MTSLFENEIAYIQAYTAASDSTVFFQNHPMPWSENWARKIVVWALEQGDAPLIEHVVQTVPLAAAKFTLSELFEYRENNPHNIEHARKILHTHPINIDSVLINFGRHLDAEWMVLFARYASDTVAANAYGTILHYVTPPVPSVWTCGAIRLSIDFLANPLSIFYRMRWLMIQMGMFVGREYWNNTLQTVNCRSVFPRCCKTNVCATKFTILRPPNWDAKFKACAAGIPICVQQHC